MQDYRKFGYLGIVLIAIGITFTTTLADNYQSLGTTLIALGGLFFIIAMSKKRAATGSDTKEQNTNE